MNEFDAFTQKIPGGHRAILRLAGDGEAKPVVGAGGKPAIFKSELEACQCLLANLVRYVNGHYTRDGEVAGQTAAEVESHFAVEKFERPRVQTITVIRKRGRSRGKQKG